MASVFRSVATTTASVSAAASVPSRTSRLMWTSCQTRYGCAVERTAAATPTRREATREPIAYTRSAVAAASAVWTSAIQSQSRPTTR